MKRQLKMALVKLGESVLIYVFWQLFAKAGMPELLLCLLFAVYLYPPPRTKEILDLIEKG
jgi:hypothetical protein